MAQPRFSAGTLRSVDAQLALALLGLSPLSYLPLDDPYGASVPRDRGSAPIAGSYSGNLVKGQPQGMGRDGIGLYLDGASDVSLGDNLDFAATAAFSIHLLVFGNATNGANVRRIITKDDGVTAGQRQWYLVSTANNAGFNFVRFDATTASDAVSDTGAAGDHLNKWRQIVVTYDGANMWIYRDGTLRGGPVASARSIPNGSYPAMVGGYGGATSGWFAGMLAHLAVWGRALTASEVLSLAQAGGFA